MQTVHMHIQYLCAVQESIESIAVGSWTHHHSVRGDSGQVTLSVLADLGFAVLGTEQLEVFGQEILCPWLS